MGARSHRPRAPRDGDQLGRSTRRGAAQVDRAAGGARAGPRRGPARHPERCARALRPALHPRRVARLGPWHRRSRPRHRDQLCAHAGLRRDQRSALTACSREDADAGARPLDRTQPMLPLRPGQIARRTHDYTRHGTASLYAAFDVATGKVLGSVTQQHRGADFVRFLEKIDRTLPRRRALHLVLDNRSTHKTPEVTAWLAAHPRFTLHFTPTSASWLNAVEGWFAQLERRAVRRGSFTSVSDLRSELRRFIAAHNQYAAKPLVWTKPGDVSLDSVARASDRK